MPVTHKNIRAQRYGKPVARSGPPVPSDDDEDIDDTPYIPETPKDSKKPKKSNPSFMEDKSTGGVPKIRGQYKVVSLSQIKPAPHNYNKQSDFIFEKLKKSIQEFGFSDPIDVRSGNEHGKFDQYEIVGGEHRWSAAAALGMDKVPVNDLGLLSDAAAKKLLIVLNETKGRPNNDQLAMLVSELKTDGVDLDVLPYEASELESMTNMAEFSFEPATTDNVVDETSSTEDEDDGQEYAGVADVLGLVDVNEADDEKIANRLKAFLTIEKVPGSKPWKALDKLLDFYYTKSGKIEPKTEAVDSDELDD
jgi:ParB-like chromosome segregation protein Spo0J